MHLMKINGNGQVSIPARLRKKLSLKTGGFVHAEEAPDGKILLTPITFAARALPDNDPLKKYEAAGVDIGLLRASLARTPTERAETNRRLLEFKEEARKTRTKRSHASS